jgi:hypothetical protein
MKVHDTDTGLVSGEPLRHARRPWFGGHRPLLHRLGRLAGRLPRRGVAPLPGQLAPNGRRGTVAGIGFTMSLFIAGLAFSKGSATFQPAQLGIFAASLLAALVGALVLRSATRQG